MEHAEREVRQFVSRAQRKIEVCREQVGVIREEAEKIIGMKVGLGNGGKKEKGAFGVIIKVKQVKVTPKKYGYDKVMMGGRDMGKGIGD